VDIPEFSLVLHFIGRTRRAIKHKGVRQVIAARGVNYLKNQRIVR